MKIRLLIDLPVEKQHGCIKGRVFDVTRCDVNSTSRRGAAKWFFMGDTGEECAAFLQEFEVVQDSGTSNAESEASK